MFWIGMIVGWLTAGPLVLLALALVQAAAAAGERNWREHDE